MKKSVTTREIDSLGRIVIPAPVRRALRIQPKTLVDIYIEDGHISIYKHSPSCVFCSSEEELKQVSGKPVCKKCITKIKNIQNF